MSNPSQYQFGHCSSSNGTPHLSSMNYLQSHNWAHVNCPPLLNHHNNVYPPQAWVGHQIHLPNYSTSVGTQTQFGSNPGYNGPPVPTWANHQQQYLQNHSSAMSNPILPQNSNPGNNSLHPPAAWTSTYPQTSSNHSTTMNYPTQHLQIHSHQPSNRLQIIRNSTQLVQGSNGPLPFASNAHQHANYSTGMNNSTQLSSGKRDAALTVWTFELLRNYFNPSSIANDFESAPSSDIHPHHHPRSKRSLKVNNPNQLSKDSPSKKIPTISSPE